MLELLAALAVPFLLLAFLRHLSHRWFPWAMRPLERAIMGAFRSAWSIVWKAPVRQWGVLNVLYGWAIAGAVLMTIASLRQPGANVMTLVVLWLLLGGTWWGLRAFQRWRLRPHRLPHRRRRGG